MARPKTKPTDQPVADFIAAVENPRRRGDAEVVQAMLAEVSGEQPVMWGPTIVGYGRYTGPTGDWPVIGFSPRKTQLVVYLMPGYEAQAEFMTALGRHKTGRSCLYINKLDDIDLEVLRRLAEWSVAAVRAKYPA
jgi:hypothetical protein